MKRITFLVALTLCLISYAISQETETRSMGEFDGIAVSASVNATVVKGNKNQVEIKVKGVELDKVRTEIEDGILEVGMVMKKNKWSWGSGKKTRVDVVITYTEDPRYISASSSSDLVSDEIFRARKMKVSASSSADMSIHVEAEEIEITTSSSADLEITGYATHAEITASSSSDIMGRTLKTETADISASSSADVDIAVSQELKASASSGADINYYGNPSQKDISRSSGGDVEREN